MLTTPRVAGPADIGGPGRRGSWSRKYKFTPELREELRLAYCGGKNELTANLDRLARRTAWPRSAFKTEARRRGWSASYRPWTPAENAFLREHAGAVSVKEIARHLSRPHESVTAKVEAIQLWQQTREGYTPAHLEKLLGARPEKVRRWIERGFLGASRSFSPEARVSQTDLLRFIGRYQREYDLARVHQEWFKALVLGEKG